MGAAAGESWVWSGVGVGNVLGGCRPKKGLLLCKDQCVYARVCVRACVYVCVCARPCTRTCAFVNLAAGASPGIFPKLVP